VYIFEKTENEMSAVYVAYESPVANEDSSSHGISHLLEHIICESTTDIEEEYDENCLETNAFTSDNYVVFYLSGLSEKLAKYKDDFIRRITKYEPKEEDFAKQLPIVTQEYNDYFQDDFKSTYTNYLSKFFGYICPIGTKEALVNLKFQDVIDFKNKYFSAPSKILVVDKEDNVSRLNDKWANLTPFKKTYNYINKDCEVNDLSVGFVSSSSTIYSSSDDFNLNIIAKMLGYGLKSPLYQNLREKSSLCYWVSCFDQTVRDGNILIIATSTKDENIQKIEDGIKEIIFNPTKYLTEERFNLMLNNTKTRIKMNQQYKHEFGYLDPYFNPTLSLSKNIDKINYTDVMNYYTRNIGKQEMWTFANQKSLYLE